MFHVKSRPLLHMQQYSQEKKPEHLKVGKLGEDIACRFLKEKGFLILERNYRKKWGELDIVCEKEKMLHFVEVKSVSREMENGGVTHETPKDEYQPEDAIHEWKIKRLMRVIQSFISEKYRNEEPEWQFDIAAVFLDINRKNAKIRFTENVIL